MQLNVARRDALQRVDATRNVVNQRLAVRHIVLDVVLVAESADHDLAGLVLEQVGLARHDNALLAHGLRAHRALRVPHDQRLLVVGAHVNLRALNLERLARVLAHVRAEERVAIVNRRVALGAEKVAAVRAEDARARAGAVGARLGEL